MSRKRVSLEGKIAAAVFVRDNENYLNEQRFSDELLAEQFNLLTDDEWTKPSARAFRNACGMLSYTPGKWLEVECMTCGGMTSHRIVEREDGKGEE